MKPHVLLAGSLALVAAACAETEDLGGVTDGGPDGAGGSAASDAGDASGGSAGAAASGGASGASGTGGSGGTGGTSGSGGAGGTGGGTCGGNCEPCACPSVECTQCCSGKGRIDQCFGGGKCGCY